MNTIVKFYLVGLGTTLAPLWLDTQTLMEAGEGGVAEPPPSVDPGQLDFSKTETSGHLVTIGVL
jgi:hypothetical protein